MRDLVMQSYSHTDRSRRLCKPEGVTGSSADEPRFSASSATDRMESQLHYVSILNSAGVDGTFRGGSSDTSGFGTPGVDIAEPEDRDWLCHRNAETPVT